jgi:hypothetical protein
MSKAEAVAIMETSLGRKLTAEEHAVYDYCEERALTALGAVCIRYGISLEAGRLLADLTSTYRERAASNALLAATPAPAGEWN